MNLATAKQTLTAQQHAERVAAILESNDAQVIATARHNGQVIGTVARFPTGRPRVILSCSEYNRRVRILAAKLGNIPGTDTLRAAGYSEAEILANVIGHARAASSRRYCGQAAVRIRLICTGFDGRPSYAGSVSFPDGRRWAFRALCPPPSLVPGRGNLEPSSKHAIDRAAACALSWCGWKSSPDPDGDCYHDDDLSDAVYEYADFTDPDSGDKRWRIARQPGGRVTGVIAA